MVFKSHSPSTAMIPSDSGSPVIPSENSVAHDHHFDATQQEELPEFINRLSQEFPAHPPAAIAAAVQTCRTTAAPSYGRGALMDCARRILSGGSSPQG